MADSRDSLQRLHELFRLREQAAADRAAFARRAHEGAQREVGATRAALSRERTRWHTLVDSRACRMPADPQGHRLEELRTRGEVARAEERVEEATLRACASLAERRSAEKAQAMETARSRALGRLHRRRCSRAAAPEAGHDG